MVTQLEGNGPQVAMKQVLAPEIYEEAMRRFRELIAEFNQADDGTVHIESEYLLIVARRRG
jgi:hypothetical protein